REVVAHDDRRRVVTDLTYVVEVGAAGVDLGEVARGGEEAPAQHGEGEGGLDRPAGAHGVAGVALGRGHGDPAAEHLAGGVALGDVADVGGGAVGVDVVDAVGRQVGVAQGAGHRL